MRITKIELTEVQSEYKDERKLPNRKEISKDEITCRKTNYIAYIKVM